MKTLKLRIRDKHAKALDELSRSVNFVWNEDRDAYICDQETYDWWEEVVASNQELVDRTHELVKEHGSEAVYNAIHEAGSVDLEEHAANANKALDEAFGSTK